MSPGGADLAGPEIVRGFRGRLARFLRAASAALDGAAGEVQRVREWLDGEQTAHWQAQVRRREEAQQEAKRRFQQAEFDVQLARGSRGGGKQGSDEERIDLRRAQRRLEEAEEHLALIRAWIQRLDRDGEPLVHRARAHDLALRELGDRALLQLDRLAEAVQAYLDAPAAAEAPPPPGDP